MIKLSLLLILCFIQINKTYAQLNTVDSVFVEKATVIPFSFWDFNRGKDLVNNSNRKLKVHKCYYYQSNALNSTHCKLTSVLEYNRRGQLIKDVEGSNITKDSSKTDFSYSYNNLDTLTEAIEKVYKNPDWGDYINRYDAKGNYLGRFKINADSTLTLISKYKHDLQNKLSRVDRYYPDGELAETRKLSDSEIVIDTEIRLHLNSYIDTVKKIRGKSIYGNYLLTDIYSSKGILLKEIIKYDVVDNTDSVVYKYNRINKLVEMINYTNGKKRANANGCYRNYLKRTYIDDSILYKEYSAEYPGLDDSTMDEKTYYRNGNVKEELYKPDKPGTELIKTYFDESGLKIKTIDMPFAFTNQYDFGTWHYYTYY